jgi:hypothetical protein
MYGIRLLWNEEMWCKRQKESKWINLNKETFGIYERFFVPMALNMMVHQIFSFYSMNRFFPSDINAYDVIGTYFYDFRV